MQTLQFPQLCHAGDLVLQLKSKWTLAPNIYIKGHFVRKISPGHTNTQPIDYNSRPQTAQWCITDSAPAALSRRTRPVLAPTVISTGRNQYHAAGALAYGRRCSDAAAVATCHHWVHNMKTWRRSQNRKYITYCNVARKGSSHGKIWRILGAWFLGYAGGQIYEQTYRHTEYITDLRIHFAPQRRRSKYSTLQAITVLSVISSFQVSTNSRILNCVCSIIIMWLCV